MTEPFDWEPVYRANYRARLLDPDAWVKKADGFLEIASLLEPKVRETWDLLLAWIKDQERPALRSAEIFGTYLMLASYAVENLLKAYLLARDRPELAREFDKSGRLPGKLTTHNVYFLAVSVGLKLGIAEEETLRRMAHAAVWYGRYPVPKDYVAYDGEEFSDGKKYNLRAFREDDVERVNALIARLRGELGL